MAGALESALRSWVTFALRAAPAAAARAALRLDLGPAQGQFFSDRLSQTKGFELLEVVNAILSVHSDLDATNIYGEPADAAESYLRHLIKLRDYREDAGSAFTICNDGRRIVERVDTTVAAAAEKAMETASDTAASLLRKAWHEAYGLEPDPTTAYRDAVRAVEQLACPLVLPNEDATLGKVIGHLKQGGHKWRFVLVDRDDEGDVESLVAMLDRIWTGQVSRHGGGKNSRDQSKAEAAVHLAATLVQLLSTDALTRRDGP